jgi:serine/threonine protein kinase
MSDIRVIGSEYDVLLSQLQTQYNLNDLDAALHKSLKRVATSNTEYSILTLAHARADGTLQMQPYIVGRGKTGTIYGMCVNRVCNYVVKAWKFKSREATSQEMYITNRASEAGFGPEVVNTIMIMRNNDDKEGIALIIMKRLDFTLYDYISQTDGILTIDIQNVIYERIEGFCKTIGASHGDLHSGNIMLRRGGDIRDPNSIKFIDYGIMAENSPLISAYILATSLELDPMLLIEPDGMIHHKLNTGDMILLTLVKTDLDIGDEDADKAIVEVLTNYFYKGYLLGSLMTHMIKTLTSDEVTHMNGLHTRELIDFVIDRIFETTSLEYRCNSMMRVFKPLDPQINIQTRQDLLSFFKSKLEIKNTVTWS